MDKKTKKELDKEIKEIQKNTLIVSKRMQKLVGLKSPEEEEDEEGEEIDDYLNDVNEEEVSTILKKAEEEMKEEEEIKKKEKEEKKEEIDKSEQILKEELDRIDEEDKENKKKNKKKKKKEKKNKEKEDEEEEDDYEEYEEYKKWKKMRKMEKQRLKQENQNNNKNEDNININDNNIKDDNKNKKDINNIKKEENKEKNKKEDKKENIDINNDDNDNNNNNNESKEPEYNFNINNIQNTDNNNINKNINNNEDNFNINNTNINNNNNIQANNKPQQVIPKNVYDKISANDKKIVSDLLKTSNAKYHEGEMFLSMGKYNEALKCFKQAKVLYLGINKLVQTKKDAYPKEFRDIMTSKINDKLKLVHQSAKNCSTTMTQKRIDLIMKKNNLTNTCINTNNMNLNNTNNINNNNAINNTVNNNLKNNTNNSNNNINSTNYNFDFNALNDNSKDNKINNKNVFKNNPNNNINNNNNNQNKPKSLHDKEEDAMDQKIMSEIMSKNPGVKFSDIIGMNEMKQTLYEIIVVPTIRPDLFTGIRTPQRGILLFGPPGTGKTMIAKAIASECGSTFFNISASSLTSKWVGESEKTVKSLFKIAYQKVPSIIFIDEIDSILSKRSESENEATKRLKTEFLIQFDGLGSNTSARLLVIAATNRPMDLDEALLRRLPKRVYCGPLDEDGRFEFIKKVINRVDTELSDEDIREIAKLTNDYSNSDLMELCREAAYLPVRELSNEEIMKLDKFRPINKNDMMKAVQKIRGTLSKKVRDELKRWNDQFGGV